MIHFVDNKGTIIKTIESPVYQGSAESNNIILIAPFAANLQFTVAFFLPNGEITPRYAMTQGGTLNGVEYAPTNGAMAIWTFSMPNNITQYFGTVYAQFYAYGTNGQITASSRTSFVVSKGVPEELPDTPSQTIYNQILTALSQINTALNSGSYAARAIYWWINTYTYGMNEITFYPIGTYGAFVRSTVTGNIGNQPYSNDGVLDSAHWQELVNFNKIYAAEQNAVESAQNAAQSEANAAASAQAAAQSASSAAQSAQSAAQSASSAAESAQNAAESASKAEGIFQNATMKNEAETIRAPWDFDTQNGPIDFFFENKDSSCVTIDGFSVAISYNNGDYIRTTQYQDDRIVYQANETTTYTIEFPEKSGTLALTSDVAAESSARESADNALQSDINGIQQQLSETQHFRGYYETTAQVQSISNPHSGDYAWNAQTGTVWNYSTAWADSGVAIPDQTVPKSVTTPLMDGTAELGNTNTYADGAHRHPTDTTRASAAALNSEIGARSAADSNLQSQINDIEDGTTVVGKASADPNGDAFTKNYLWHNNGQSQENTLRDGTVSRDFNDYVQTGRYELHGYANNPLVNFPTSYNNSAADNADWFLDVYARGSSYLTQIATSVRADGAIALRNKDNNIWGPWLLITENGITPQAEVANSVATFKTDIVNVNWSNVDWTLFDNIFGSSWRTTPGIYMCRGQSYNGVPFSGTYQITLIVWLAQYVKVQISDTDLQTFEANTAFNVTNVPLKEIVTSNGSYPTLGAGYLAKQSRVNVYDIGGQGWFKIGEVSTTNTGYDLAGIILLVNGLWYTQAGYNNAEESGIIEIDCRAENNGLLASASQISILAGNLSTSRYCIVVNGLTASIYWYAEHNRAEINFTILNEAYEYAENWTFNFASEYYGTSAPSGAVYAVNRNQAAKGITPASNSDSDDVATTEWVNDKISDISKSRLLIFENEEGASLSSSGTVIEGVPLSANSQYEFVTNYGTFTCYFSGTSSYSTLIMVTIGSLTTQAICYKISVWESSNGSAIRVMSASTTDLRSWSGESSAILYKIYKIL